MARLAARTAGGSDDRARQPSGDGAPASDRPSSPSRAGGAAALPPRGLQARARGRPRELGGDRARPRPGLRRPHRGARTRSAGSTATRSASRPPGRPRGSRPGARSARSRWAASRSCGRRGTTRSPTGAMGFCIFGNAVIAARHAQAELGIERVAIVDWDVHHGNGTEAIVRGDDVDPVRLAPPVAVLPRHGWPGHERRDDRQHPARRPARATRVYADAFRTIVEPAVRSFEPELADRLGRIRRARRRSAGRHGASPRTGSGRWPPAARSSLRASPPCSRAATTSRRCPASSRRRSRASRRKARSPELGTGTSKRPGCGPAVSVRFHPASSSKEPAWSQYAAVAAPASYIAPA